MGRKILFITTDQQRYDSLGCNGGTIARTPVVDGLAANGVVFRRAHPQNVVCMPSRSTMITGQNLSTHGVWMNGVPLPADAPTVAGVLHDSGYRTAIIGKAHFEPFLDPFLRFNENRMGINEDVEGPHRGFDHLEFAAHGAVGLNHYARWLTREHPNHVFCYYPAIDIGSLEVNPAGGGDTDAPQTGHNQIPRDLYHTDWVADRTISWLDGLAADDDWFCWMSFPDPHHPWDPPASEVGRVNWRDLDLPAGFTEDIDERAAILDTKPRHWRKWWDGELVSNYEAPARWVPATLTADQVREVNARTHVENELIDEAIGRVLGAIAARGWDDDTDIIFTTDHGELQGDFGFLFKGPYHVDALMRLPLVWRPAPSSGVNAAAVEAPVGLIDLAPTFCEIAGVAVPEWMEGKPLPSSPEAAKDQGRERVMTEWDSRHATGVEVHLRTIHRDGLTCTTYKPGTVHEGNEGELYDHAEDPLQFVNLWDDPSRRALRDDLVDDLRANTREWTQPKRAPQAPV